MVAAPSPGARARRFGPFELDPATGELRKFGLRVALQDQPLQVLTVLLERPGELVTREELRQRLWPADTYVDFEHGLNAAVKRLRDALGDSADRPTFIETVPRRGYRFIAAVDGLQPANPAGATVDAEAVSGRALQPRPRVGALSSRVTRATLAVVAVTAAAVLVWRSVWPGKPHVSGYSRLMYQEVLFPPFPSEIPILTDGPRIYFTEWVNGRFFARQVSASGGEAVRLPLSLGDDHVVDSVSPDGSELLVLAFSREAQSDRDLKYWIVPTAGGTPRRLGDVTGHSSHWLRDGRILYAHESEFFFVNPDGTGHRKLMSVPGRPYWPRVSPDGSRIRFSLFEESPSWWRTPTLWEARIDGTGLRRLLPGWNDPRDECCGDWTEDGAYFIFQATRQHRSHLWAMRDGPTLFGDHEEPVQLTSGPLQFRRSVPSRDGTRQFAIGWHLRGELTRFDKASGAFVAYLSGISAEWADHSRDDAWVAYVSYPEAELWRARADGTARLRLTTSPMRVLAPRWSPDGTRLAFTGLVSRQPNRVFLVSRDGGELRLLQPGGDPTWSSDGRSIAYHHDEGISILEVETDKPAKVPGSERLFSPRWSPDGRYLVALSSESDRMMLYDFRAGRWSELCRGHVGFPNWSRDGRHVYFRESHGLHSPKRVLRVRIDTGEVEPVMAFNDVRVAWGVVSFWLGLAPDDSPLFLRDRSTHEIYALDWVAP